MLSDICLNPLSEVVPIWSISSGFLRIVRQNQNRILHGNHAILINIAPLNILKLGIRFRL